MEKHRYMKTDVPRKENSQRKENSKQVKYAASSTPRLIVAYSLSYLLSSSHPPPAQPLVVPDSSHLPLDKLVSTTLHSCFRPEIR